MPALKSRRLMATLLTALLLIVTSGTANATPPSNDNFADRTRIPSLPYDESQDTLEATAEPSEPDHASCAHVGATLWYEYTPLEDGVLQADTFGSDFDTVLVVWTGSDLTDLTEVACDDDTGLGLDSTAVFAATAGTAYLIQVGGSDGEAGALSFRLGPPTEGSISGTVTTSNGGAPLPQTCVQLRTTGDGWGGWWAETSSSGRYTIDGLPDGTYQMRFFDGCDDQRDHTEEWFDNQPTRATATDIVVTSPQAVTGIDAELTALPLGLISGTVTSSRGGPLTDICVEVYNSDREYFGTTRTTSSGSYTFGAPDGTYNVYFFDGCGDDARSHEDEWFDDQPDQWTATDVVVTAPTTTSGIDAELTALGSISGMVTSDKGNPLPDVCIEVYDTATGYEAGWAETTSSGTYTSYVPAGTYHVEFSDRCDALRDHRREWFDDQPTEATASNVIVTGSNTTDGIDAELTSLAFGSISGTVTSETGAPLSDICVDVYDAANGEWAGWAETTASGSYTVSLPEGAYHVDFADWCDARNDHEEEWFDNQPTRETATEVLVTAPQETTGIDAVLTPISNVPQTFISGGPFGTTRNADASFGFWSSVPGSTFECSLDGADFSSCTAPANFTGLSDGSHTFQVRATSPQGGVDPTPASRSWVVDASPPILTFERPTSGTYVNDQSVGGTGPVVVAGYVTVRVTATDPHSGAQSFRFDVDGNPVAPLSVTRQGDTYSFTYRPASPGTHTITAYATNGAGLGANVGIAVLSLPTPAASDGSGAVVPTLSGGETVADQGLNGVGAFLDQ